MRYIITPKILKKTWYYKHYRALTEEFIKAFNAANDPWKTLSLIAWHTGQRLETCKRIAEKLFVDGNISDITITPGKTARFGRAVYIPRRAPFFPFVFMTFLQ